MTKKGVPINTIILCAALIFGGVALAQEPVQDISKTEHPNLAEAQSLVIQADKYIEKAQKESKEGMQGHAEKARALLTQANQELKLAAAVADKENAAQKRKQ
jgi:hypothetical protein